MMRMLLVLALALMPSVAVAADCNVYVDASVTGRSGAYLTQVDYLHFTEDMYGVMTTCAYVDKGQANGPYYGICKQQGLKPWKDQINYFKGPRSTDKPALFFDNDIWYSSCATDIKPFH